MDYIKINAISSAIIAFSTTLGVMFAIIYYFFIMIKINILQTLLLAIIYIDILLIFLYILKTKIK